MQLTRIIGKIFHLNTDVVRKLEDKDEEYLKNFVDVTEGADGRMIIGVLQALDDARRISQFTFQVTTAIHIITIVSNLYFLFIGGSHFSFLTIFISVGAWIPGEKSELDIVCEKIKSAVLTAGIDAVCDLTKVDVHGKTLEEMEELVDDAIDEMTIMGLIPYFKKYVVGK